MHGSNKGIDPNLRPEWLVRMSQKPTEKSRIEKKGKILQDKETKFVDQVNSRQRGEIRKSQMEQSRENIP